MLEEDKLALRFGPEEDLAWPENAPEVHRQLARRGSVRKFSPEPVPNEVLLRLCALALCAPTKSDLQQRDIIIVDSASQKAAITAMLTEGRLGQKWLGSIPNLLIFCGNNRRQRRLHGMSGKAFANDHLDAFFNAAVDAAIALSAFVIAAEAEGLGVCPISAVRNHPDKLAALLRLPDHVFPVAGLAVGYPDEIPRQSYRLPLSLTVHHDSYCEDRIEERIDEYDRRRMIAQPYASQRYESEFGQAGHYGWSEDKARQYALPERQDFGNYVRKIGFKLD